MYYTYNYRNQKWISSNVDIYQSLFTPFSVKYRRLLAHAIRTFLMISEKLYESGRRKEI